MFAMHVSIWSLVVYTEYSPTYRGECSGYLSFQLTELSVVEEQGFWVTLIIRNKNVRVQALWSGRISGVKPY